jgi:sterol desaturase/sphingolipid hydroxylase (fatty acid hydroxylase superfamily)
MSTPSLSRSDELRASPPLFRWTWLDKLTRVHPAVPAVLYGPVIAVLGVLGVGRLGPLLALAGAAGGYVLWTLTEYWLHRIVFHFEPEGRIGSRLHFLIHGVHHVHPNDPKRLVMPPAASVPLAVLFLLAFTLLPGDAWTAVGAGFLAGYVAYDTIHFYVHHHRPTSRAGRFLREAHMRHHFQDDTRGYGVSAPWWDRVFGTATRPRAPR